GRRPGVKYPSGHRLRVPDAATGPVPRSPRHRRAAVETLTHLAVLGTFGKAAGAIHRKHPPPKRHGAWIALILHDFPITGEAVKDQPGGVTADADSAVLLAHEKLGHVVVHGGLARGGNQRARDQGKAHGFGPLEYQ